MSISLHAPSASPIPHSKLVYILIIEVLVPSKGGTSTLKRAGYSLSIADRLGHPLQQEDLEDPAEEEVGSKSWTQISLGSPPLWSESPK